MIIIKVVFWLLAIPIVMIIVGVVWLWVLYLIGGVFTGVGSSRY